MKLLIIAILLYVSICEGLPALKQENVTTVIPPTTKKEQSSTIETTLMTTQKPEVTTTKVEVSTTPAPVKEELSKTEETIYDQRQNGTENYRINIDGVVLVIAPPEALLLAAADMGGLEQHFSSMNFSKPSLIAKPKVEFKSKTEAKNTRRRY